MANSAYIHPLRDALIHKKNVNKVGEKWLFSSTLAMNNTEERGIHAMHDLRAPHP